MPRYEFTEGASSKFWQIVLDGSSFTTTFGRIGSTGQSSTKAFPNEVKAKQAYEALIAEKVKKGYRPVDGEVAAAPVRNTAVAQVSQPDEPAAPEPVGSSGTPLLTWTPEFERKARLHLGRLALEPRTAGDAGALRTEIQRAFVRQSKPLLEHGLPRMNGLRELQNEVIWRWSGQKVPDRLEVETEAAALLLVPPLSYQSLERDVLPAVIHEKLIDFWVAHSGLSFAVEAFARSVELPSVRLSYDPPYAWLSQGDPRTFSELLRFRTDRILRGHLLAAPEETRAELREKALKLRKEGNLLTRSALSAVILDPEWIDADLLERVETKQPAYIVPEMVIAAGSTDALAPWFNDLNDSEFEALTPSSRYDDPGPSLVWCLLAEKREKAVVPLARWLARAARGVEARPEPDRFAGQRELLEALSACAHSPEITEAACAVLSACSDQKISKLEDPRPLANAWLLRNAAVSFPIIQAAARNKGGSWARDLLPQLERLAGHSTEALEEASADELPQPLRQRAKFKAPAFWNPVAFAAPKTRSGKGVPQEAMDTLGALLAARDPEVLQRLKEELAPDSLSLFAWDLFQAWLTAGAPSKEKWAFLTLGSFGNDESARRLTPLVRSWPGESAHQRAVMGLDVLAEIGSDVALMMLNGIAQKVKFKGLQEKAREKMDEIAARRGLMPEELADRLVPDLDLEEDGSRVLDFGPRSFRVGFDETLSPFVMDASGTRLKDLPKPNSKDDPELSSAAVEQWKAMKKDARAVASVQILRLELAMGNERRWRSEEFHGFLLSHPLLIHVVRRLVWGVWDAHDALTATFRVAEDRSLASIEDDTFELEPESRVGIVHPLHLDGGTIERWKGVFADYGIIQPFDQLTRQAWRLDEHEQKAEALERFMGRKVETKKVMGLLSRGWNRGPALDGGGIGWFVKRIGKELSAAVTLDPGIIVGAMDYTDPVQELGTVAFGTHDPGWGGPHSSAMAPSSLPTVVVSEIIRDLEALGSAEETSNEA